MKLAIFLTAVVVLLQLMDAYTTYRGMVTGVSRESNPVLLRLNAMLLSLGFSKWAWLAIAKSWALIVLAVGWLFGIWQTTEGAAGLVVLIGVYGVVVWKNYLLLKQ